MSTAILPTGWRDRLIVFETPDTALVRGLCLEPHDLVVSKLVAFRDKDREFAASLLHAGLVDTDLLQARIGLLNVQSATQDRLRAWLNADR